MKFAESLAWVNKIALVEPLADLPADARQAIGYGVEPRLASVLVPLFWRSDEWHILYIRRVENDRDRHSGQVAFPGGRREPTDADATETALREAEEEIGLARDQTNVLGSLSDYYTSSNYLVTPVVGIVPWPYSYHPQPSEVDRVFSIPLKWLCDPANMELRERQIKKNNSSYETTVIYFKHYDNELLWGATARMTLAFLKALYLQEIALKRE